MATSSVVIVGAGQAGSDVAAGLRAGGFSGQVVLIGDEDTVPYQRPPLSKGYLAGTTAPAEIALRPTAFYPSHDIDLVRADRATGIDRESRRVTLASGRRLRYDTLVLATGARPRWLPAPGMELDGVLLLRGLADADRLRARLRDAQDLVVVGAGFLGLEVAATARVLGHDVTVVEAAPRVMGRAVSAPMSGHLAREHRAQGVRVLLGRSVTALRGDRAGRIREVELDGGERVRADLVLVGVGVLPDTGLAEAAGLATADGVLVDARLRTTDPAIRAIGDCARFPDPAGGRTLRLESVQNASGQARYVAAALCERAPEPYRAVPWFWSEQYGMRLQIAGATGVHDRAVIAGDPYSGRFSVFCFHSGRLLGVESVNRPADHMITRRLLAAGRTSLAPEVVAHPSFDLKSYQQQAA